MSLTVGEALYNHYICDIHAKVSAVMMCSGFTEDTLGMLIFHLLL